MSGKRQFGSVRKRTNGRYDVRYRDRDGNRHSAGHTFPTAKAASAYLSGIETAMLNGTWISPAEKARRDADAEAHQITVAEYAEYWIPTLKSLAHRHNSAVRFRLHINPVLGHIALAELTRTQCDTWYRDCCRAHPTQRARCYENLRAMLNHAVERDLLNGNPLSIRGASSVAPAREPQTATVEQLAALLDAMPERDRAGILIAAWCGLRVGEVTALQRQDVTADPSAIVPFAPTVRLWIRRHVVQNRGRAAGEPSLLIVPGSKADEKVATVVVPPHVVEDLWKHFDEHVRAAADAWLFPSRTDPSAPLHPSTLDNTWQRAKRAAGLARFTYHDLRRTGSTLAAESGATLGELMERLRHRTITAAQRYIVAAQGTDVALAERMSARTHRPPMSATPPSSADPVRAASPVESEVQRRLEIRLRELGIEP